MSTPRSRRVRARIDLLMLLTAALGLAGLAHAKQTDKNQPIHINANAFAGSQDSGKITFTGGVRMDQGTFQADGAKATGYYDPNDTRQLQRMVLTGDPAHFQQTQDSGMLVHGQAQTIDYKVSENTVILTGNAEVVQQGRGEFHGDRLVYNTDTGEIQGTPATGGRVHITLQPRSQPPASAGSTPAPAASSMPASAASTPASALSATPVSSSTAGSH